MVEGRGGGGGEEVGAGACGGAAMKGNSGIMIRSGRGIDQFFYERANVTLFARVSA